MRSLFPLITILLLGMIVSCKSTSRNLSEVKGVVDEGCNCNCEGVDPRAGTNLFAIDGYRDNGGRIAEYLCFREAEDIGNTSKVCKDMNFGVVGKKNQEECNSLNFYAECLGFYGPYGSGDLKSKGRLKNCKYGVVSS